MTNRKWQKILASAQNPPSLTKQGTLDSDIARRREIRYVIHNFIDWPKDAKILALGCGDGYELDALTADGYQNVIGLTNHKEELSDPRIVAGDMHDLPFENESFDYVYSKEVLEHSPAPYIVLCELNRVIKKGFLHLISTGPDKQREWYHFSCFPDWVWYDLFKKTEFVVDKILTHKIQSGFYGHKLKTKDMDQKIALYDLRGELERIPRDKLIL